MRQPTLSEWCPPPCSLCLLYRPQYAPAEYCIVSTAHPSPACSPEETQTGPRYPDPIRSLTATIRPIGVELFSIGIRQDGLRRVVLDYRALHSIHLHVNSNCRGTASGEMIQIEPAPHYFENSVLLFCSKLATFSAVLKICCSIGPQQGKNLPFHHNSGAGGSQLNFSPPTRRFSTLL